MDPGPSTMWVAVLSKYKFAGNPEFMRLRYSAVSNEGHNTYSAGIFSSTTILYFPLEIEMSR